MSAAASPTAVQPGYDTAVFINCPYSDAFADYLHAIIFTVVCCGMEPRSALSVPDAASTRIERLARELCGCRYSIHDLSLLKEDDTTGVAHMNMPLELGMAVALHRAPRRAKDPLRHDWTALVLKGSAYKQALSDANGNDLPRYGSDSDLVTQVLIWLRPRVTHVKVRAKPDTVVAQLTNLRAALSAEAKSWFNQLPWQEKVNVAREVAQAADLLPAALPAKVAAP